jgi:hypothetical protein
MSIVRIGMAENKNYAAGYDAIFGKKGAAKKPTAKRKADPKAAKRPTAKKAAKKK